MNSSACSPVSLGKLVNFIDLMDLMGNQLMFFVVLSSSILSLEFDKLVDFMSFASRH